MSALSTIATQRNYAPAAAKPLFFNTMVMITNHVVPFDIALSPGATQFGLGAFSPSSGRQLPTSLIRFWVIQFTVQCRHLPMNLTRPLRFYFGWYPQRHWSFKLRARGDGQFHFPARIAVSEAAWIYGTCSPVEISIQYIRP